MAKNIIPTINISSIVKNGFESPKSIITINKIKKACINIGFFQVTGHGISQKNIKNICNVGNKFFNSSEKKKENFLLKSGILKIKMYIEDIFLMMLMGKKVWI
jgi:isopenicillin N synthase-like dioxygenase